MTTISMLLNDAIRQLADTSDSPRLDAALLLSQVLEKSPSHLLAWPEKAVTATQQQQFRELLNRRIAGEPVAYLLGVREFWSQSLRVSPATLIPRPDTERLVEAALEKIPADRVCDVLDFGTGTGAIALAIAGERPQIRMTATDNSPEALDIARENAARLGLPIRFREGDWWHAVSGETFDFICSNPPYIPEHDPHLAEGDVRFEPRSALVSGHDGLDAIRNILGGVPAGLRSGGWIFIEHGHDQGEPVAALLRKTGLHSVQTLHDLAGNSRVCIGRQP